MEADLIKILVIANNFTIAEFIRSHLNANNRSSTNFKCDYVLNLSEAIQYLQSSFADIILLDSELPDTTSIDSIHQLQKDVPSLPIVVISNSINENEGIELIKAGAQDHIDTQQIDNGSLPQMLRYAFERHQVSQKNSKNEERYRLISEVASDYLFSARVDLDGNVTQNWLTGATERITSYSYKEFLATGGWRAHLHPEDLQQDDRDMAQLHQNKPVDSELRLLRKDGSVAWVQVFGVPIWSDEENRLIGIYGSVRDITQRKVAEAELQKSKNSLEALIDAVNHSVFLMELDGTVVSINETTALRMNSTPSEMIGKDIYTFVDTEVAESRRKYAQQVIDSKQPVKFLDQRFGRIIDNSVFPVLDKNGEVYQLAIYGQDITEMKQAEEALRESEERNRMIVSSAAEAIILQQKSGKIITWNKAAEQIFGLTAAEAIGQTSTSRHWETYREDGSYLPGNEHPSMLTFTSGEPCHNVIVKIVRSDHSFSWVSINTNPVFFNEKSKLPDAVIITIQDITQRYEAEENLRERERELSALLDNLPGMAYRCLNDRHWTMTFISQGCTQLTGYHINDLINNKTVSYRNIIHPDDQERVWSNIQNALKTSQSFVIEYRIITANGRERWVWERGSILQGADSETEILEGFITDITERRQAKDTLQESEARFRYLFEQSPAPYQSLNEKGVILEVNQAWLQELGYSSDEVIGHWFGDFLSDQDCELFPQRFEQFKKTGEIHGVEFDIHRRDGSLILISFEGKIIRDAQDNFLQTHCVFTNITERRQVETRLQQYAEGLNKAQAVANVGSWKWRIPTNQLEWSDEMYTIFGIQKNTFNGDLATVINQAIHPDDREDVRASNQSVLEQQKLVPLEYRVIRPDGNIRTVWAEAGELILDDAGNPFELTGIVQDITDRKQTETRLLRQDAALMAAANGILITKLDATIEWANPAFSEMTGYSPDEVIGNKIQDLIKSGMHQPEYYTEMWKTILAGNVWRGEFINQRKDGSLYNEHDIITPILNSKGEVTSFIAIKEDISQRKKQEQRLLRQTFIQSKIVAMGRALGATIDINIIYRTAYRYLREIMDIPNLGITLFDPNNEQLRLSFAISDYQVMDVSAIPALPYTPENPNTDRSRALATQQMIISNHLPTQVNAGGGVIIGGNPTLPQSAIYVPMLAEGKPIGVLDLQSYQKNVFTTETGEWLSMIANQVALAIHNSRLYEQIRKRMAQLSGLREIDTAINAHRSLDTTLQLILNQVRYQLNMDAADILTIDPDGETLSYRTGYGFKSENSEKISITLGYGLAGTVAKSGRMIHHPGSDQYDSVLAECPKWNDGHFQTYIGIPLWINETVIGVFEVFHRSLISPDPEWQQYLETLAGQAAIAIENSTLINDLQKTANDLLQAYDATIEGWSQAMDMRDHETEGHTQRVTSLTVKMAERLGLPKDQIIHIRRGALLHDIGKLGVPDHILLKPGPLTPQEWEIMKLHPEYAFGMLREIDYLQPAINIPYFHHEKWDGSGYPFGLQGDDIPLAARIFAIVDVWDAVTNDRPYHQAWSFEEALSHIKNQRGKHFDPEIVDIFLDLLNEKRFLG